jgi:hypothetical protein
LTPDRKRYCRVTPLLLSAVIKHGSILLSSPSLLQSQSRTDCSTLLDHDKENNAPPKLLPLETGFYGLALDINNSTKLDNLRHFIDDAKAAVSYDGCLVTERTLQSEQGGMLCMQVIANNDNETTSTSYTYWLWQHDTCQGHHQALQCTSDIVGGCQGTTAL